MLQFNLYQSLFSPSTIKTKTSKLLELLGVKCIQLRLEFHDLETNLALDVQLLGIVQVFEEDIISVQGLLYGLTGGFFVVVVVYRSARLFCVFQLINSRREIGGGRKEKGEREKYGFVCGVKKFSIRGSN